MIVNMETVIELPARLCRWLPATDWLVAKPNKEPRIRSGKRTWKIHLLESLELLEHPGKRDSAHVTLAASAFLSSANRRDLERQGFSYLDSHGHCHIVGPDLLIHIDEPSKRPTGERTEGAPGLGVDGVRAVEALFEKLDHEWSVTEFGQVAKISAGHAHRVLMMLEKQGLILPSGTGPRKRRRVRSPSELLDWLAGEKASVRRNPKKEIYLYSRNPAELWATASRLLGEAKIDHCLTGVAAAALYDAGPTTVAKSVFRIDPDESLDRVAGILGAEQTSRGANLVLMSDVGRVGIFAEETKNGVVVAPKVRIYLDSLADRRGDDIARIFRETALGY